MSGPWSGEPAVWYSEGALLNPGITDVLATTGAVSSVGNYQAHVILSSDATATINIQWRNAADSTNNKEQRCYFKSTDGGYAEFIFPMRINAVSERLRVIPNAAVTGNVSASIIWQKMA